MAESVGPAMCPGVLYLSLLCFVQITEVNDSVVDQMFSKICHFMLIALWIVSLICQIQDRMTGLLNWQEAWRISWVFFSAIASAIDSLFLVVASMFRVVDRRLLSGYYLHLDYFY